MAMEVEHLNPSGFFVEVTFPSHTYTHTSDKLLKHLHFAGKTFLIKLSNRLFVLWLLNTFRKKDKIYNGQMETRKFILHILNEMGILGHVAGTQIESVTCCNCATGHSLKLSVVHQICK